jgi:NAD(P)H-quinone oxidoreductase subunit 5
MTGVLCVLSLLLLILHQIAGGVPRAFSLIDVIPDAGFHIDMLYDGVSGLMLLLVSFVGFIVSRFSVRYLDGEAAQGRYFRWMGFTVGAVSLMVTAGNLLFFFLAWVMTSLGLHQLLLHYRHRPAAHRAAWTKFAISRLGDAFLICALVLSFRMFGTFEFTELFSQASRLAGPESDPGHKAIAWLLMLGAITKSAQFPFHVWLPDTMETPTPVSALMHAGIVNAGGYLVIRMSPMFELAPMSLSVLALVGTLTACFGGIVMMTQSSIKRSLAYSTIAQMGFMMLQCGLGAFSAAMLHIIAHSVYKAYAFLSSGSAASMSESPAAEASTFASRGLSIGALLGAMALTMVAFVAVLPALGISLYEKPGGGVLALILYIALTTWGWRLLSIGWAETGPLAFVGITGLCFSYIASYVAVDYLVGVSLSAVGRSLNWQMLSAAVLTVFAVLFALHTKLIRTDSLTALAALRVHAGNGFYVDALYHRIFASLKQS